jgi:acetate kinase
MNVLVLNCGSSSLRFQVIATDREAIERDADRRLAWGRIERIGSHAVLDLNVAGDAPVRSAGHLRDHRAALDATLRWLIARKDSGLGSLSAILAVGHRVVHGGEALTRSVVIDDAVIRQIEGCIELAPRHNPANLSGIQAARDLLGAEVPQVAVFDTSFHTTMPDTSYLYAIPYSLYVRHRIRRYGFHGTSHRYVAYRYRKLTGKRREDTHLITLHLGNGCSACAIQSGRSIDTSMGLTPLEGLVMGTRSGDVDPSILEFLHHKEGMSVLEMDTLLNKQSGLLGVSGLTHDMRDLLEEERAHGDRRAALAIDMFCLRVRKYIGAYLARMNGADAVVFTGGIGEHGATIRERVCAGLDTLGIALDPAKNAACVGGAEGDIAAAGSRVRVFVIPTNEELLIARDTVRCVGAGDRAGAAAPR